MIIFPTNLSEDYNYKSGLCCLPIIGTLTQQRNNWKLVSVTSLPGPSRVLPHHFRCFYGSPGQEINTLFKPLLRFFDGVLI